MALLALHTNHSKHRAPAMTAVGLAGIHREDQSPPSMADFERRPDAPLRIGDVVAETPRGVQIPVALFPTVGINRPGTERWPVLMKELDYLSAWVRTQAIPRLITGTEPPHPALPARYEITTGHDDERRALSAGVAVSATQLHSDRLGAAAVRRDMIETLSQMDGAPSTEAIAVWLESLSDQEMLARMRQIQAKQAHGHDVMLSNFAVLEAMRDDARRFAGMDELDE